jgi:hypothetical protein
MAVATPVSYTAGSGQRVLGGRFPAVPPVGSFPAVPATGVVIGSVVAPAAGTLPVCMGAAFRQGDVAANATFSGVQMTAKNAWPDGSIKFAVLAFGPTLAANTARPIGLSAGAAPGGAALSTAQLRAFLAAPVTVAAGAFGAATWSGADWEAPFMQWVSGPLMSSWIYRKPIGSDAHLVAWLEVRLFIDGSVEVLPWIENGYIAVASPTNKSATYTFSLSGTQRFSAAIDLKHHQRTPLTSGAALSHWLGTDPGVVALHDSAYMQASELVPTYGATLAAGNASVTAQPATFTPLQQGSFDYTSDDMAQSGYQRPIGLLPEHDVLHLVANAADRATTYRSVIRNGYSAGRYGIHYRDEATNRPLRFSQHPTRVIADSQGFKDNGSSTTSTRTAVATGGNPPAWDVAHSPSVGFMAYLLTGRFYFMEEVLFAATVNYLGNGDNAQLRTGSQGLVQTAVGAWQTRSAAWDWRSKVQALTVVPDDDTALRTELIACVESNIAHFHGRYVAQANNPFGFILPGEAYDGNFSSFAPWQQDFVTASFGYSLSLGLPVSTTRRNELAAFFVWKAQAITKRLGQSANWWYINGAPYNMTISPGALSTASFVNGTGPWLSTPAEAYAATFATPPAWLGSTEGTLAFEFQPDYQAGVRGMWGNLQPALAYAVRHGVPGAVDGYTRMTAAANWAQFQAQFNLNPVWAVRPASGLLPAWRIGQAVAEARAISGTSGGAGAAINAWGTLPLIEGTGTLVSPANGGHNDSSDNRVTSIDLLADAPAWVQRIAPSPTVTANASYMPDGKPVSRHGYHHAHYISQRGRVMLFGSRGWYSDGGDGFAVDGHTVSGTWAWDAAGEWTSSSGAQGYGTAHDPVTGNVWASGSGWRWEQATDTWTRPTGTSFPISWRWPAAYDSLRRRFFTLQYGDGQGFDLGRGVIASRFDPDTGAQVAITFNSSAALTQFIADAPEYAGMDYDPANDRFLFYDGRGARAGRIFVITPNSGTTWDMSILATTGAAIPATVSAGINGRFRYIPRLGGFIIMPDTASGIYFLRTH